MKLPEDDEEHLRNKGLAWQLVPDGNSGSLIIANFNVSAATYDRDRTDLMIRIPAGYPIAQLDMFYVDPPLKLKNGGNPPSAEVFEEYAGRKWQRFSRHLNEAGSPWQPGVDGIHSFLALITRELRPKI